MTEKDFKTPASGDPPVGIDLATSLGVNTGEIKAPAEKANHFGKTVIKLIKYLKPEIIALVAMIVIAAIGTWFAIWVPEILKKVTNHLVDSIQFFKTVDMMYIGGILLTCIVLYILSALFQFTSGLIAASMSQRVVRRMRWDIKCKYDKVALGFFDTTPTGDTLSRVTNDVEIVAVTLQDSINQIITGVMTVIGVYFMMARIDWILSLVALISIPMFVIVTRIIVKRSEIQFTNQQRLIGQLNGHIEEIYSGHSVIKMYGREEDSIKKYEEINKNLRIATRKAQFLAGVILPAMRFINNLAYVLICVIGALFAGMNRISIGDIQAFITYVKQFSQPVENVANIANTIQSAVAAAERVFQVLELEEMVPEVENPASIREVNGKISMEHVAFSYVPNRKLITDLSLEVKPGETIAIVGPTGAGKTTLVNLLLRFYEMNSGSIKVDGVDIRNYTRNDLRSMYGMVLQDTWLFNGTVAENIAYGAAGATKEQVVAAAKKAYAHSFIEMMENGYDTILQEDASNISQGQRQLLTIARAILKDPKIIILDEATSSVDTRTEIFVQKAMLEIMEGRTSFVIAHRLSTIRNADKIIVMNKGDVVETGTHDELMEKQGFYCELYNCQFSGKKI